jgi:hypothetical protein
LGSIGGTGAVLLAMSMVFLGGPAATVQREAPYVQGCGDRDGTRCRVYDIPSSVASNCTRDVTGELNRWIASVPDGSLGIPNMLLFGDRACYRVDGTMVGVNRSHLVFDGNGSVIDGSFVVGGPDRSQFRFHHGTNLILENLVIRGSHPNPRPGGCVSVPVYSCDEGGYYSPLEWQHAFELKETDNAIIRNNRVSNVYGDHVALTWELDAAVRNQAVGRNILVENNVLSGAGRHCISLGSNVGVRISGNSFSNCSYHVIDLEPEAYQPVRDIVIENNKVGSHRLGFVSNATGLCNPGNGGDVVIRGNEMTAPGVTWFPPIRIAPPSIYPGCNVSWSGFVIENNILLRDRPGWPTENEAIQMGPNVSNVTIRNNEMRQMDSRVPAVRLDRVHGAEVRNNTISGASSVYRIDGAVHGPGVYSCGNTTDVGANQPEVCPELHRGAYELTEVPGRLTARICAFRDWLGCVPAGHRVAPR